MRPLPITNRSHTGMEIGANRPGLQVPVAGKAAARDSDGPAWRRAIRGGLAPRALTRKRFGDWIVLYNEGGPSPGAPRRPSLSAVGVAAGEGRRLGRSGSGSRSGYVVAASTARYQGTDRSGFFATVFAGRAPEAAAPSGLPASLATTAASQGRPRRTGGYPSELQPVGGLLRRTEPHRSRSGSRMRRERASKECSRGPGPAWALGRGFRATAALGTAISSPLHARNASALSGTSAAGQIPSK